MNYRELLYLHCRCCWVGLHSCYINICNTIYVLSVARNFATSEAEQYMTKSEELCATEYPNCINRKYKHYKWL